jgi:hypothetical protein
MKKVSIKQHEEFLYSLLTPADFDEIDAELDDLTVADPYELHAPSRRSDKDLARMLDLLDSLPTANDRKETTR